MRVEEDIPIPNNAWYNPLGSWGFHFFMWLLVMALSFFIVRPALENVGSSQFPNYLNMLFFTIVLLGIAIKLYIYPQPDYIIYTNNPNTVEELIENLETYYTELDVILNHPEKNEPEVPREYIQEHMNETIEDYFDNSSITRSMDRLQDMVNKFKPKE